MTVTSNVVFDPGLIEALEKGLYSRDYMPTKYDMKIGMLVFVKTKGIWQDTTTNIPSHWYTPSIAPYQITPTTYPTTPLYPSYPTGGGGTYTPHTLPSPWINEPNTTFPYGTSAGEYYCDPNVHRTYTLSANELSKTEMDQKFAETVQSKSSIINELLSEYTSNFGGKLGMSMMSSRNSRKSTDLTRKLQKISTPKKNSNKSVTLPKVNTNINTNNMNVIGNAKIGISTHTIGPLPVSLPVSPVYTTSTVTLNVNFSARGFKSIKDYYRNNETKVEQKETWTEEETKAFTDSGFSLYSGKPFHGIIVDKFVPKMKSEKGEEIDGSDLNMPVLYKVLFGEKNILWFTEEDLLPMKPKECATK